MIRNRLAAFLLVLIQAILVGEYAGEWTFSIFALLVAASSFRVRRSIHRWIHVSLAVLAVVVNMFAVEAVPPAISNDWVISGKYVVGLCRALICLQLIELLKLNRDDGVSVRFAAFAMAGMLTAFCRYNSPLNSPLFFCSSVLTVGLFAVLWMRPRGDSDLSLSPVRSGLSMMLLLVTLALGTAYLANGVRFASDLLRFIFVSEYVEARQNSQHVKIAYSATGNLDAIARFQKVEPDRIALRSKCEVNPGYLRGRVFSRLTIRGWKPRNGGSRLASLRPISYGDQIQAVQGDEYRLFDTKTKNRQPFRSVSVQHAPQHVGNIVFTPLEFDFLEGNGKRAAIDEHGVVIDGLNVPQGYRAHVAQAQAPTPINPVYKEELLQVPERIRGRVGEVAAAVTSEISLGNDGKVIATVEDYFRNNYQYSLEAFRAPTLDRISYFIKNRPASHCEYFATGAAVLLRINGVPARYVTGFIVDEIDDFQDTLGDQWLARNKHAHAWVEAYDRQKRKWVVVEATPGINVRKDLWEESNDVRQVAAAEGELRDSDRSNFRSFFEYFQFVLRSYGAVVVNVLVSILVIGVLYWMYRNDKNRKYVSDYELKQHSKTMRRLEKRLRKMNLVRLPSETLHQFADRILQSGQDVDWMAEGAAFILNYARLRYSVADPGNAAIRTMAGKEQYTARS